MENNIINEFNLIINSVPQGLSDIEKMRWLYIKLGDLFCYNYFYTNDGIIDFHFNGDEDFLNKYQTCVEITEVFNYALNHNNLHSETLKRPINDSKRHYIQDHVCNLVTLSDGSKYILDLTLDLFLIQGGFRTRNFAYTTKEGDEEIIPHVETKEIDQKLGLMKNEDYLDEKFDSFYIEMRKTDFKDFSFEEKTDYRMNKLSSILPKYKSFYEGKEMIDKSLAEILRSEGFGVYQLRYNNTKMISVYIFMDIFSKSDSYVYYIYDNDIGLIKTNKEEVLNLLDNGYTTKSNSLFDVLNSGKTLQ